MKKRRRLRFLVIIAAAVFGLSIVTIGFLARQVVAVQGHLTHAMELASELGAELSGGDETAAARSYDLLEQEISSARSITAGPLWNAASFIPLVGPNFSAVREVSVSVDDVAVRAIGPLLDEYESLDWRALTPSNGRVNTDLLRKAEPSITTAASSVEVSYERISAIDTGQLLPSLADPIRKLTEQLNAVRGPLRSAASLSKLLPTMLGNDSPRNYLLLIQNSSEARATGGIPGALAVITATDGRVALGAQSSASAMGFFDPPILVDEEQLALFTGRLGNRMQNVNMTPDFPTAASTARSMWELRYGQKIDGVLALDPLVLGHFLSATGPVSLTDTEVSTLIQETNLPVTLSAENVSSTLLADVYKEIEDPDLQDLYFAEVASAVFEAFTEGRGDASGLLDALVQSVEEDRLFLWSRDSSEQQLIATTRLAGSVSGPGASGASFGVFFNDGTGGKMDYFAERTVALTKTCSDGGSNDYAVTLDLKNNLSAQEAAALPGYVTGEGRFGVPEGHIQTNYHVYGPVQSLLQSATVNGESVAFGSGRHAQRPVGTVTIELAPGESARLQITFTRVIQDGEPRVRVSPGASTSERAIEPLETVGCN